MSESSELDALRERLVPKGAGTYGEADWNEAFTAGVDAVLAALVPVPGEWWCVTHKGSGRYHGPRRVCEVMPLYRIEGESS